MIKKNKQYTATTLPNTGAPGVIVSGSSNNLASDINKNKVKQQKERLNVKKEQQIDSMSNDEVVNELKEKKLPTFGTAIERKERLKKHYGLSVQNDPTLKDGTNMQPIPTSTGLPDAKSKKSSCLEEIERLKQNREERRKRMDDLRKQKTEREQMNELHGYKVDVDFQVMVEQHMNNVAEMQPHIPADQLKICVCVKKRPVFQTELTNGEIDCVSVSNPNIIVHECKFKVDGITKYVDNSEFQFDNAFSHVESNHDLYHFSIRPLVDLVFNQGIVTVFAYGQTGSGKTFTMQGLQEFAIKDLFDRGVTYFQDYKRNYTVTISMYEIYGGKVFDLLNNHEQLKILEDKQQKIQIQGLKEQFVQSEEEILNLINFGNSVRTTHATKANDTSSRSHAICQIKVHEEGVKNPGKLLLVDLAGSERAQDCQSNNKERQQEGAEINKSLLALKECIRALDQQKGQASQGQHVPFRSSKLTMVLRDSFLQSEKTKIVMLACICPGSNSADHTLNTLRYAERLKERSGAPQITQIIQPQVNQAPAIQQPVQQTAAMTYNQNQLEDQLRLFKKQNSLKYITNQDVPKDDKKALQPIPKSGNQPQRESLPAKKNGPNFYHQNTNKQQLNNRSFSNSPDQEEPMTIDDNNFIDDAPTPQAHQLGHNIRQQQPTAVMKQPHESPVNKQLFTKVQSSQPAANQKHNFQQQSQKVSTTSMQSKIPAPSSTKQIGTAQGLRQTRLIQKEAAQQQDDSFISEDGRRNSDMHRHPPNNLNQKISPKMQAGPPSRGGQFQQTTRFNDSSKKEPVPQELKMNMSTPPQQHVVYTPYQNSQQHPFSQPDDEDMVAVDDDERIAAEETILNGHLECVKQEAQLITQEGELITKIEKAMVHDAANYDMRGYLDQAEKIARKKLEMYSKLLGDIQGFKHKFGNQI